MKSISLTFDLPDEISDESLIEFKGFLEGIAVATKLRDKVRELGGDVVVEIQSCEKSPEISEP